MRFVNINSDQATLLLFSEGELRLILKKNDISLAIFVNRAFKSIYIKGEGRSIRYSVLLFQPELIVDFTRFSPLTQVFFVL